MPTRIALTIRSTWPRVFLLAEERSAFIARANSTAGAFPYRTWWNDDLIPYLEHNYSSASYVTNSFFEKMLGYCLAVYLIDSPSFDYFSQARGHALYACANYFPTNKQDIRDLLLALCAVFDLCNAQLSASDKTTIQTRILAICDDNFSIPTGSNSAAAEMMDGHTRIDQALTALACLTLGVTGTRLDRALDFWYGGNAGVSAGSKAAMDTDRYYSANGGAGKGPHYQGLANYGAIWLLHALSNATNPAAAGGALTFNGDPYYPWSDEAWFKQSVLWFLYLGVRGDGDYFRLGDTLRQNNPVFSLHHRVNLAAAAARSDYRPTAHWLYDQWQAKSASLGQGTSYTRTPEFLFLDRASDPAVGPTPTSFPLVRGFLPAGAAVFRNTWDLPNSTIAHVQLTPRYYRGHRDNDVGLIQISHKKDMVLLNSGMYSTSSGEVAAAPGGSHLLNWAKQGVSKSGIPLCDDGSANPHGNYNSSGSFVSLPGGLGSPYFKTFGSKRDCDNVDDMRNDGEGLAWLISQGVGADEGYTWIGGNSAVDVLYANTKRAYLKEYTDLGTSAERLLTCEIKLMWIKDQQWPCMLRLVKLVSRTAGMVKRDQWHFWGNPVLGEFDARGILHAKGYLADQNLPNGGKILISYDDHANLSVASTGGAPSGAFGSTQFFYDPHDGSGGRNYPPDAYNSTRHYPDIGRYTVHVAPKVQTQTVYFACLLVPLDPADTGPSVTWISSSSFRGVRFPDGKLYQIGKDDNSFISPGGAADSTPPVQVTGLAGSTPGSGRASLVWTPISGDPSMDNGGGYRVYRRKV